MNPNKALTGPEEKLSPELRKALRDLVDEFERDDQTVRERQLRQWKRLKYLWDGFSNLWWSETAHDWRIFDLQQATSNVGDSAFYDKPVNVFKALLESIIAALSAQVPAIKCYPDDAQNALDILTAKGGDRIAELVSKHNDGPLLFIHALYLFCTEGMLAAHNKSVSDEKFGTYPQKNFKEEEITQKNPYCPSCGQPYQPLDISTNADEEDEFQPGDDDVVSHDMLNKGEMICRNCLEQVDPELKNEKIIVQRFTGVTQEPKSRQIIEVYGGLNVKVPNYARCQKDIPYLRLSWEAHKSDALSKYKFLHNKGLDSAGGSDIYERWARNSLQYFGEFPMNTITWNHWWFRPQAFECIKDEPLRNALKKRFPDGAFVCYCNDEYCESYNCDLDDEWTIAYNPLADFIHYEPLGMLLVSVQEIINEVISLTLQTIEHGIPQTFADTEVLNFKAYKQAEARPGDIFPVKPKGGKTLDQGFFTVKTATLSQEVLPFSEKMMDLGQLASGALPSLWGGAQPNSSKTAAQYSMSRAQSLQRLQTPWKVLTFWWKNIFAKVIPQYIKTMKEDERWVEKGKVNEFINVIVSMADMQGRLGSVELEANEQLPQTWGQNRDIVMQLMGLNNPAILSALTDPENIEALAEAIGLDNFEIPGEDDRTKQYEEISLMLQGAQVQIDPLVDDHKIEADICRRWCVSEAGRSAKVNNQQAYQAVIQHMQQHLKAQQALQQMFGGQPQMPPAKGQQSTQPQKPQNQNQVAQAQAVQ